jgi:D-alanine-D-alanine ligase
VKIAVLHNLRPAHNDAATPDDMFEDYDSQETIAAICAALAGLGVEPVPVVADRRLPWRLEEGRFDFAFNIAEGEGRRCREAIPAAVCELLGLPFTGSDALTLAAAQDKAIARRIVSPEIPIVRAVLVDTDHNERQLADLTYPVIVKPNDEGSSKGIGHSSVCASPAVAAQKCRWLQSCYGCPALVEEFLPGMEVTVAVRGNGDTRSVMGLMEIAPAEPEELFVYDVAAKRDWRRRIRYHVPPRLPAVTLDAIGAYALKACRLLGCHDLARIDFRLDDAGQAFFLECNPLPGLNPSDSDIVILSRGSVSYDDLVQGVLLDAGRRVGLSIG